MRKYNVYNLKVVKNETSSNTKYLICRYNNLTHEYVEVLTGEKIKVKNNEDIEPLSNYYSVLSLQCYGIPNSELKLTKKDILNKYLQINNEMESVQNEEQDRKKEKVDAEQQPFDVLAVSCDSPFVIDSENVEEFKNTKVSADVLKETEELAEEFRTNNLGPVLKKTKKPNK